MGEVAASPKLCLRDRLHALAELLPSIESPDFSPGHWETPPRIDPAIATMPIFSFSNAIGRFETVAYEMGWVLPEFDWSAWGDTDEARALLEDPTRLALATPQQIAQLLTGLIRCERFSEGTLSAAFKSGLIARILRRAAVLEDEIGNRTTA